MRACVQVLQWLQRSSSPAIECLLEVHRSKSTSQGKNGTSSVKHSRFCRGPRCLCAPGAAPCGVWRRWLQATWSAPPLPACQTCQRQQRPPRPMRLSWSCMGRLACRHPGFQAICRSRHRCDRQLPAACGQQVTKGPGHLWQQFDCKGIPCVACNACNYIDGLLNATCCYTCRRPV